MSSYLWIVCFSCGHRFKRLASTMRYQSSTTCPRCGRRIEVIGGREMARAVDEGEKQMRRLNQEMRSLKQKLRSQIRRRR